jgi:hypothetical protein
MRIESSTQFPKFALRLRAIFHELRKVIGISNEDSIDLIALGRVDLTQNQAPSLIYNIFMMAMAGEHHRKLGDHIPSVSAGN